MEKKLGTLFQALAYYGQKLKIPITVVLPVTTDIEVAEKCQWDFGASVILHGENLAEAKKQAFVMIVKNGTGTYISG